MANGGSYDARAGASMSYTIAVGGGGGPPGPANAQYVVLALDPGLSAERVLTAGTGITIVDGGANGPVTISVAAGFFAGFAAPTAQVGLTAIAGVAVTAIRSDGAPRLNVGISPTGVESWTGTHTWAPIANTTPVTITKTGSIGSANLFAINPAAGNAYMLVRNDGKVWLNINTARGLGRLHVAVESPEARTIMADGYGVSGSPEYYSRRALGTVDAPTRITSADFNLVGIYGEGFTGGSGFVGNSSIRIEGISAEDFATDSDAGAFLQFSTTAVNSPASAAAVRMLIDSTGFVGIGTGNHATPPGARLHVIDATEQARIGNSTTSYLSFGVSATVGSIGSTIADNASAVAFQLNDSITRTTGLTFRIRNANLTRELMVTSWDGRFSFGYSPGLTPQVGHVLSFIQTDSDSPAGAPHMVGILGEVSHTDATKTATIAYGIVGIHITGTATGASYKIAAGLRGTGVGGVDASLTGKILAGVSAGMDAVGGVGGLLTAEPGFPDPALIKGGTILRGSWDHVAAYWADAYGSTVSTLTIPTNRPGIVSSFRAPIQPFPFSFTVGSPFGETWGIRGEAPTSGSNGSGTPTAYAATYPALTGFMRVPYPRYTGGTGVRAMQLFWEPWPIPAAGYANVMGDMFYSDGTNLAIGLWHHNGTALRRFLTQVAAPSAYTPTNVTTDRAFDANSTTIDELADVLGTLIADLQAIGAIG